MKNLLPLLFIFLYNFSFGQSVPLDSFYTPGTTWTQVAYGYSNPEPLNFTEQYHSIIYKIEKDTIIVGVRHHIVSYRDNGQYWDYSRDGKDSIVVLPPSANSYIIGSIRVDTLAYKVYFTQDSFPASLFNAPEYPVGIETEIYDFSLAVGDTFQSFYVTSIDSVTLSDGRKAGRYNEYASQYIIFGIGARNGFLSFSRMFCYDNPKFYYHFPDAAPYGYSLTAGVIDSCFDLSLLGVANVLNSGSNDIRMYPNPVTDGVLHFDGNGIQGAASVAIYDITGRAVGTYPLRGNDPAVSVSSLSPGTYLCRINPDGNGAIMNRLLVIR